MFYMLQNVIVNLEQIAAVEQVKDEKRLKIHLIRDDQPINFIFLTEEEATSEFTRLYQELINGSI